MYMFITVTNVIDRKKIPTRVNVNQICHYNVSGTPSMKQKEVTCISFQGDSYIEVLETPEEIDWLIEDAWHK